MQRFITRIIGISFLTICLLANLAVAQVGGQPGTFLLLPQNARSTGMGNVSIGLVEDASSVLINPGMLGLLYDIQFNITRAQLQFERNFYNLSLAYPAGNLGNIGAGWIQFSIDDIIGRDQQGFTTHTFSDVQSALVLGYGRIFGDRFSLGLTGKLLDHRLAGYMARGATFDLGTAAYIGNAFTLGAVMQNVTSSLKWNTSSELEEKLPLVMGTGISYLDAFGITNLVLAADINMVNGALSAYRTGAEYIFADMVIIRTGYSQDGITFGGGIMYRGAKLDIAYSSEPFGNTGRLHFTLNWLISPGGTVVEAAPATPPVSEPSPTPEEPQEEPAGERRVVLIVEGPLKYEKAEVLNTNVANNTITVRLLALPDSEPVTLRLDQVEFVK